MTSVDKTILALRSKIDELDEHIISLLAKRSEYVDQVGKIKKKSAPNSNIIRPGREAKMIRKMLSLPRGNLLAETVAAIWRNIIAGSIAIEQPISISAFVPSVEDGYKVISQAQECYGSFTSIKSCNNIEQVISDIKKKKEVIGIFPARNYAYFEPWFIKAVQEKNVRIFACLPFIKGKDSGLPCLLAGQVIPEKTGDDVSLILIRVPRGTKPAKVKSFLKRAGFKKNVKILLSAHRILSSYYLIEEKDFIDEEDRRFAKLRKIGPLAYYLGSYANPVVIKR